MGLGGLDEGCPGPWAIQVKVKEQLGSLEQQAARVYQVQTTQSHPLREAERWILYDL